MYTFCIKSMRSIVNIYNLLSRISFKQREAKTEEEKYAIPFIFRELARNKHNRFILKKHSYKAITFIIFFPFAVMQF